MQTLSVSFKYRRSTTTVITASEVVERYLFGIPLISRSGQQYSDDNLLSDIEASQLELENYLDLKISKQIINESRDYVASDWKQWGYIGTSYPVNKAFLAEGYLGQTRQMSFPQVWLSIHKTNDQTPYRRIYIIPNADGIVEFNQNVFTASGILPHVGFSGNSFIPNYWRIQYCTGFDKIPADLLDFIGRFAAAKSLLNIGDGVLPLMGISSSSLSIDGLSQSKSFTQSGQNTLFGGRLSTLMQQMKDSLPYLQSKYKGITVASF